MKHSQIEVSKSQNSQNLVVKAIEVKRSQFEALLSQDQLKKLLKVLPVGYSFVILNKNTRLPEKKIVSKEPSQEEVGPNRIGIEHPKCKNHIEVKQIIKGTREFGKKCKTIIELLRKHKFAEPFFRPVDQITLRIPDYFDIIKEPMDFQTIHKKLHENVYVNQEEFEADVRKIWTNSFTYNLKGTQIYSMTEDISNYFERLLTEEKTLAEAINPLKTQVNKLSKRISDYEGTNPARFKTANSTLKVATDKQLSYEEKKSLSQMIRQLPPECLWDVWKIVAPGNGNYENEEVEFDIDSLPPKKARELELFVTNKLSQLNRKKEPLKRAGSTTDFERLGNYANLESKPESKINPLSGANTTLIPPSFEQFPENKAKNNKNSHREEDDYSNESSFISSLEESNY
jgi:hypothetical protein